ncbi:hypothetical protein DPM19_25025 [Actinomadura craniellae]|uniref:Uncharacterized protein n=1 Tax=Actinomadura craniellae TaxID=2231787 RepID=A0A365GZZ6_9ACTN|nr:hypothetical protein [Actinomadura craniellae]RAY12414.1 hypothetical protein DPM19_25025 [Actinomadura craniellae]
MNHGTPHRPADSDFRARERAAAARRRHARGPLLVAAGATALLIVVDLAVRSYHEYVAPVPALRMVFNVGAEGNLASWWNSALLLSVAGAAIVAALLTAPGARPGRPSWLALAAAAAWLSFDETVQVHERLAGLGQEWAGGLGLSLPTYTWVLPGAAMALTGAVLAVLWARRLPRDQRLGLLGALAVYVTGALVVEAFNGWANRQGAHEVYALGTSLEEAMEMGACLLALAVLARMVTFTHDPDADRMVVRLR